MNCAEVNSLSSLYLSGELDASRSAAVAKHLATCASCALQLQMHGDLDNLLRQAILSEHISTAALDRRVHERISAEVEPHPLRVVPRRALVAVAVAVIFLLVVGLGYALVVSHPAPVYADAAADHHDEIIDQQSRQWLSDPAAIASLAREHGVSSSAVTALAPAGYHLGCAKICRLNGHAFLHLVFVANAASKSPDKYHEVSLFLCSRAAALPRSASTKEDGRKFYVPIVGPEHLACFETKQVTALVVTDQAGGAALNFARSAAGVF
jgi:putative zinc finger protein